MEKIKASDKRNVLIRVALFAFLPLPIMIITIIFGLVGGKTALFKPGHDGHKVDYIVEELYPKVNETKMSVSVSYEGETSILLGNTLQWEGEVPVEGKIRPGKNTHECFTLFWLPIYQEGLPASKRNWRKEVSAAEVVDLTGWFGEPGLVYSIGIKDRLGNWLRSANNEVGEIPRTDTIRGFSPIFDPTCPALDQVRSWEEIYFFGENNALVGKGDYDVATGLLVKLISIPRQGLSLALSGDNLRRTGFADVLLPFILIAAVALAAYEIFYVSVKEERRKSGMPVQIDFAFFGYSAVLIDLYLDFALSQQAGTVVIYFAHVVIFLLFWFRFGIWSILPFGEILLALLAWGLFQQPIAAFTYFPASISAWLMALLVQGAVSPGTLPEIRFIENYKRNK